MRDQAITRAEEQVPTEAGGEPAMRRTARHRLGHPLRGLVVLSMRQQELTRGPELERDAPPATGVDPPNVIGYSPSARCGGRRVGFVHQ